MATIRSMLNLRRPPTRASWLRGSRLAIARTSSRVTTEVVDQTIRASRLHVHHLQVELDGDHRLGVGERDVRRIDREISHVDAERPRDLSLPATCLGLDVRRDVLRVAV